jgi:acyl carrier protein
VTALRERVLDCFCTVFPSRSREELLHASRESVAEWDSLAGITLLTVLQQELDVEIDLTDWGQLDSVASVLDFVSPDAASLR